VDTVNVVVVVVVVVVVNVINVVMKNVNREWECITYLEYVTKYSNFLLFVWIINEMIKVCEYMSLMCLMWE
jgi:hypothetical protein